MKLKWQVSLKIPADSLGRDFLNGYGDTPEAARADLYKELERYIGKVRDAITALAEDLTEGAE